ncbi:hypothetical protein WA026_005482 [Henosepilachna vigintioctopunctata]|uniref:Uncharacterized protein n=1 Tax=Henosepilachna vigintioctopunctata TaxID=420089 RepID=A0AAW1U1X5_9CUCU
MLLSTLIMGPLNGESSVLYLFARRRFGWNEIDFSVYNSVISVVQILGGTFALAFFSKYLNLDDSVLGIIAMLSRLCAVIVFAFAKTGLVFYIGGFIEVFQTTCHISMRALMSKTVPPHELGQSNSVFGLFEAVTPLIFGPVYSNIYSYTIKSFPGMFFIFSGLMHLITLCLFVLMYKVQKSEKSKLKEKQRNMEHEPLNTGDGDVKK